MVELLKLAIANPVNAVVVVLCLAVVTLGTGAATTQVALAVLKEKQRVNEVYQIKVIEMSETLIRVEGNQAIILKHIEKS